jgi:hypothetical protein
MYTSNENETWYMLPVSNNDVTFSLGRRQAAKKFSCASKFSIKGRKTANNIVEKNSVQIDVLWAIVTGEQKKSRKLLHVTRCPVRTIVNICHVTGATDFVCWRFLFVGLVPYFHHTYGGNFAHTSAFHVT